MLKIGPPKRKDLERLRSLDIAPGLYQRYVRHFICSRRYGKQKLGGKFIPAAKDPQDRIKVGHLEITKALSQEYSIYLYPDRRGRKIQRYFVVRVQPDGAQFRESRDELLLPQIQRYLMVIQALGVPSLVFLQDVMKGSEGSPKAVHLYYFLRDPEVSIDEGRRVTLNLRAGAELLEALEEIHGRRLPRRSLESPIQFPELYPSFYEWIDIDAGTHTIIRGANGLSLESAIRQSRASRRATGTVVAEKTIIHRGGLVPRIEAFLLKRGVDILSGGIHVLPSEKRPLELPLSIGSTLVHPVTLRPLAATIGEAMRRIFFKGGIRSINLSDLEAQGGRIATPARITKLPPDQAADGVLPAIIWQEHQLGTVEDDVVRQLKSRHQGFIGRNRWWDKGLGRKTIELRGIIKVLYQLWGDPWPEAQKEESPELAKDNPPDEKGKTYRDHTPRAGYPVPLRWVRLIMDNQNLWVERVLRNGCKKRFRDFKKENRFFTGWLELDWASSRESGAMLHSKALNRIPGLKGKSVSGKLEMLEDIGIRRIAGSSMNEKLACLYERIDPNFPPPEIPGEDTVQSLEEGLWILLNKDPKRVRELYSEDHAERIIRMGRAAFRK